MKNGSMRNNKKVRMGVIIALLIIVGVLFYFWKSARIALGIAFVALLVALGLKTAETDINLNTLVETGSISESIIQRDDSGNLVDIQAICDATDYNYNCDDFATQAEAQSVADQCNFDVFGLDRDKDGLVCESLPAGN